MKRILWDLSKLSSEDIDEIIHLKKALSIDDQKAFEMYAKQNPGKIRSVGKLENGELTHEDITIDGVKTLKNSDVITKIIGDILK